MKIIEIILKLAFLALAIMFFATSNFTSPWFTVFLAICFILGFVLIFNKHESYGYPAGYPKMKNVYMMRQIEGVLLVVFSVIILIYVH